MSNKDKIRMIVDAVSNEKEVAKETIFEALEAALVSATKKRYGTDKDFRVAIDPDSGEYVTFRRWTVVDPVALADEEEHFVPEKHLTVTSAEARGLENAQLGDVLETSVESVEFGRIAAQTARQVIMQRLRAAKREQIVEDYRHRVGELITGSVKKVNRDQIIIDLGNNAEAFLKRNEALPREAVHIGDRVRAYLKEASSEGTNGPQLILSRTCPEMLVELFKIEVPEIGDGLIEIQGAARDPGVRAKIAVHAKDTRIDPVGACVGMRGSRVQAVSNELGGERVDIVLWNENPAQFVINALAPAEVKSIVVDDDAGSMDVIVTEDQLSSAIGRNGQNVRLASQMTKWELNVISETAASEKEEAENAQFITLFQEALDVDEEFALLLVEAGFTQVDEVAYVPDTELLELGLDEDIVEALQANAKNHLLTQALVREEKLGGKVPAEDLVAMEGMDDALSVELASRGILSREDLAEQSVDDLVEIDGVDETRAAQLIMTARAPWFDEDASA